MAGEIRDQIDVASKTETFIVAKCASRNMLCINIVTWVTFGFFCNESLLWESNSLSPVITCCIVPCLWFTLPLPSCCTVQPEWNVTLKETVSEGSPVSQLHCSFISLNRQLFSSADRRFYCGVAAELRRPGHPPSRLLPAGSRVSVLSILSALLLVRACMTGKKENLSSFPIWTLLENGSLSIWLALYQITKTTQLLTCFIKSVEDTQGFGLHIGKWLPNPRIYPK